LNSSGTIRITKINSSIICSATIGSRESQIDIIIRVLTDKFIDVTIISMAIYKIRRATEREINLAIAA
jgi:hypothetical protein